MTVIQNLSKITSMRVCAICEKRPLVGGKRKKLRGKYNPTVKRVRRPNLQWARLSSGKKIKICTKCIKKKKHLE